MVRGLKEGFLERRVTVGNRRADDMQAAIREEWMISVSRGGRSSEKAWRREQVRSEMHRG